MPLAEVADRAKIRRIKRHNHHKMCQCEAGLGDPPRRIQPNRIAVQPKGHHQPRVKRRLPETAHITPRDLLEIKPLPHQLNDKPRDMASRHKVLHIRRQQQCLIDIPGAKILAHSPRLNQTRSELNRYYSDRLLGHIAMRFMMLMIPRGYETAAPGTMPPADAVAAMMKYNQALKDAGVLIALDGLHPPSMGARVSFAGGKPVVTDGPFAEAKEVLGGYWMTDVKSREEAIAWARRCPASNNEIIEIRQVQEMSDFPAEVQKAAAGLSEMQGKSER